MDINQIWHVERLNKDYIFYDRKRFYSFDDAEKYFRSMETIEGEYIYLEYSDIYNVEILSVKKHILDK